MTDNIPVCECRPNYEQEYYRHIEEIERLTKENQELKDALIGMCKTLFIEKEIRDNDR